MPRRLDLKDRKTVLLFYKEYEADRFIKFDRYLRRVLRPLYIRMHHRQKKSGFAVSFELMKRGLEREGYEVLVNDYATAKANPTYPVGLVGYPMLLDHWNLPNPAILGPSLYDHPLLAPKLFEDARYKKYAVLAEWTKRLYEPVYGNRCFCWFAGIDVADWPDFSTHPKTYDFLVYDKIRWEHEQYDHELLQPILEKLAVRGLTYKVLRYKMHDHQVLRQHLSEARGFLFLCEHETQGLAYQETMACNVPVLAWDRGYWADPLWYKFSTESPVAASSVPFFDHRCGEKFVGLSDFEDRLTTFLRLRSQYRPRQFVEESLSPHRSAEMYASEYFSPTGND